MKGLEQILNVETGVSVSVNKKKYSLFHGKWFNTPVTLVYAFKTSICGRRHVLSAALGGFYIPVNE